MKHMLSDFVLLLLAQHVTQRALHVMPAMWHELRQWARTWRPVSFAEWPRQREW
ncbi:MAG: hypothetical protein K2R93_10115 [Gemmatimonadaceae bacterium]|nr:hypothetical protein [Gemmatimonadaceae bacterium]